MEPGLDSGQRARADRRRDLLDGQEGDSTRGGVIGVGGAQRGGPRTERPVTEQVTGQSARPGGCEQLASLLRCADRLAPVTDHLDATLGGQQVGEIVHPGDVRACALVHHGDALPGGGGQQRLLGVAALTGRDRLPGRAPSPLMFLAGQ